MNARRPLHEKESGVRHALRRGRPGMPMAMVAGAALALLACGDARDVADLAVGVSPFEQLRGINFTVLRSGSVRAVRNGAEPSPFEGLREPIGVYDVLYAVTGYSGGDGSWPAEDALILGIEATREWPSDTAAIVAWRGAIRSIRDGLASEPQCAEVTGPGFRMRVAEWDRGEGWSLSASVAPAVKLGKDSDLSARHSVAVRRTALTARYPQAGQPNPDERPTWTRVSCLAS